MMERSKFLSIAGTLGLAGLFRFGSTRTASFEDYLVPMRTVLFRAENGVWLTREVPPRYLIFLDEVDRSFG